MAKKSRIQILSSQDLQSIYTNYEKRFNEPMNQTMRKMVRRGETGPGAKDRKISKVEWPNA